MELHISPYNHTLLHIPSITEEDLLACINPVLRTHHHILILFTTYFSLVKLWGPKVMSDRKPFSLKPIIAAYNILQVVMNAVLLYDYFGLLGVYGVKFWSNVCQPVTAINGDDPVIQRRVLAAMQFYYVNKIIDLFDTVFFVLRKKQSQITFLHLFHHTTMVVSTWATMTTVREEISVIFAGVNAFIHIVMYTYYFLSSLGPSIQKYLWWKKYITSLQIVQFIIALSSLAKMKLVDNCQANPIFWNMWLFNVSAFLVLFLNFYIKSYTKKSKVQ